MTLTNKPFTFTAPPLPKKIIETSFMVEMENRFKDVFFGNGFLVWYGASRAGKTTCAEWLSERINTAFEPDNPLAFKAILYEAGENTGTDIGKRTLRSLYKSITGYQLDGGTYRDNDVEHIAGEVLYAIKRKRIGALFIDEAGLLPVKSLSALALLLDLAKGQNYYLTVVLIGMDDLPLKMDKRTRPQLHLRVHNWCNFKNYSLEDSYNLLTGLHPYFDELNRTDPQQWDQVRIVHELTGGLPGLIVQYLAKFDSIYRKIPNSINTVLLQGIHLNTLVEYKQIMSDFHGRKTNEREILKEIKESQKKAATK